MIPGAPCQVGDRAILDRLRVRDHEETLQRVARDHGVDPLAVIGRSRLSPIARARLALYAALVDAGLTYDSIGELLGREGAHVRDALRYWTDAGRREKTRAAARTRSRVLQAERVRARAAVRGVL